MYEEFDKDKIQVGSSLEESWFFYYTWDVLTGNFERAKYIYSLLVGSHTLYGDYAKLYRYLFMEDDLVLLEEYLVANGYSATFRPYYKKLKDFLQSNKQRLANEMMDRLQSHFSDDNLEAILEFNKEEPDTTKYMYEAYLGEVDEQEKEKLEDYEIALVFDVCEKRYDDFTLDLKDLLSRYGNDFNKIYNLFMLFNNKLRGLEDRTLLNDRCSDIVEGSIFNVLSKLLMCNDFYRVSEIVEMLDHDSMEYLILHEQSELAIEFIKEHELNEKRNMVAASIDAFSTIEVLPLNVNGEYDAEMLANIEPLNKEFEDLDQVNYFDLYRRSYANKNYYQALRYLMLFKSKVIQADLNKDVDYLFEELMIKLFNYMKKDASLDELEDRISFCEDEEDYRGIIDLVSEYNALADVPDPRYTCMACYAAYKMGDYEYALRYYESLGDIYLGPDDYAIMMECALELYDFSKVLDYGSRFNHYEEDSNVKVNYMMSIAYAHMMDFDSALEMIRKCREMNNDFFDIPNTYKMEEDILKRLKNGEDIEMYSLENFYDFQPTNAEMEYEQDLFDLDYAFSLDVVKEALKKFKTPEEKVSYMLTVLKILIKNDYDKQSDVLRLCEYLEKFLNSSDIPSFQKELYTFKIKNYKKI